MRWDFLSVTTIIRGLAMQLYLGNLTKLIVIIVAVSGMLATTAALAAVPVYSAEYLGPGLYASYNAGARVAIGNTSSGPGQPWFNSGNGPQDLP